MSTHPALAIGVIAGGPGTSPAWADAVRDLGRRVIKLRGDVASPLSLNVTYQIPGQFLAPDFTGVRTGRYSRADQRLLVQVALPPEPTVDAATEVRGLLRDAVVLAESFAQRNGYGELRLEGLRDLLRRV